ncbi:hypothetical protein RirG_171500 [Rhizophagus irregularis DAOM 197198w]|uniref:Uncharacterized protein n=2 Tax=Rhizophagus irregularis TaxID=588596 RepID=A0A015IVU2_RHIIW|nr:hypothetical protein RirG_171500 [Rhizophagus irregularis DAOM 197198w]
MNMQLGRENIGIISKNAITIVHKLTIEKFIANLSDNFKKMTISDKDIFTSINTGTSGKGGNNNKKDKKSKKKVDSFVKLSIVK